MSRCLGRLDLRVPGGNPEMVGHESARGHITFTESTDVARVSWNFWKGARWKHHDVAAWKRFPKDTLSYGCFFHKNLGVTDTLGVYNVTCYWTETSSSTKPKVCLSPSRIGSDLSVRMLFFGIPR